MSVQLRRLATLLAALVVLPVLPAHAAPPPLPDRIAAAWRTDRIFVDARIAPAIPATELDRIRDESARAGFAVYVALVPRTPYLQEKVYDLPTLLQARVGQPGLYIVRVVSDEYWSGAEALFRPGGLKGRDLTSVRADDGQRRQIVDDRPAPQIVRTIQQAATAYDGRPLPQAPAGDLEPPRRRSGTPAMADLEDRSAFIGVGVGGFAGFVLVLVLSLRRRRPGARPKSTEPTAHHKEVRQQADQMIRRATQSVRKLERQPKLSVTQLDQCDDANRRLDAARTLRADQPDDLLAVTGALVLARQAHQMAGGGKVQRPCFFDPTHRTGTTLVAWDDGVEVPACRACDQRLRKGKTPYGLQVSRSSGLLGRGREFVPYWTLDPEDSPMVATGFGALTDDLAERVCKRPEDVR